MTLPAAVPPAAALAAGYAAPSDAMPSRQGSRERRSLRRAPHPGCPLRLRKIPLAGPMEARSVHHDDGLSHLLPSSV